MQHRPVSGRPGLVSLIGVLAAGALLSACVPEPEPTPDPELTLWFAPGCYESDPDIADIRFTGVADQIGNLQVYESEDGTCVGGTEVLTVVRAADNAAAYQRCVDLGLEVATPPQLPSPGAPPDAYLCPPLR